MKQTNKYVKTRGQKTAMPSANHKSSNQLLNNVNQKKSVSKAISKIGSEQKILGNVKVNSPAKSKKIAKQFTKPQKQNKIKKAIKQKSKKIKIKAGVMPQVNIPINKTKIIKIKSQKKKKQKSSSQSIKVNGFHVQKKQKSKIKLQNEVNQSLKKQKQKNPKMKNASKQKLATLNNSKSLKKQPTNVQSVSKVYKTKIHLQKPQNSPMKISIPSQIKIETINVAQIPVPRKKGRPRNKVLTTKPQPSLDEKKSLDDFIQHAIKLRKLKNQKQFYECFSRITQYVRQSWQFGDLKKTLSFLPPNQEVMRIGVEIARGIRKLMQQQQQLQQQHAIAQTFSS